MSKLLEFIRFQDTNSWSPHLLLGDALIFSNKYPKAYFKEFTNKGNIEKTKIEDNKSYKILGVRSYGLGVYLNREVLGSTLTMKTYQKAKVDHLFWCKVDTKNGAFGIVTDEFKDGLGSSNMAFAELDITKIYPEYLQLFFKSKKFNAYMDGMVVGTTNRKYIKFNDLLNDIKIPLPPLDVQKKIVQSYQNKLSLSVQQEKEAEEKEKEIEEYLYKELGITLPKKKEKNNSLLEFISYKDTNTWSYEQLHSNSSFHCNSDIECIITSFDTMCTFKKKQFKKKEYDKTTFDYIDIGSVEPLNGILESKKININKAPSRATQHINTGDLIIATTRPYLKKFAIVDEKYNDDVCSSGFTVIEYNPTKYNLEFVKEFLQSFYGIEQLKEKMTGGLYPAITLTELKTIKIPNPDIQMQNKIALYIKQLKDEIKSLKEQSIINKSLALEEFEKEIFNEIK